MSLFPNLITGFVPEFVRAYTAVVEHESIAIAYWISFYVIGVLAAFNIFASLIIDIFLVTKDKCQKVQETTLSPP